MIRFRIAFISVILCFIFGMGTALAAVRHDPWKLIIYRPENSYHINEIRCWLKLEDEDGNDITYTKTSATYEWVSIPNIVNRYKKRYYLMGGMAMHLTLQPGKYRISFHTPAEETAVSDKYQNQEWTSNTFFYDTENPAKVIFVYPEADENGFYNGKWYIDHKAPAWFKFTKPKM